MPFPNSGPVPSDLWPNFAHVMRPPGLAAGNLPSYGGRLLFKAHITPRKRHAKDFFIGNPQGWGLLKID